MTYSIHLFELARLNSEIKYVANSIVRDAPSYAYPNIIDIHDWQSSMLRKLDQWAVDIPRSEDSETYIELMCKLRYHSLRMVLLRPSPAIPSPSVESLKQCHHSAISCLRLFDTLYKRDLLVHNWITFHSLIMSIITMFYCIWNVGEIARNTELDVLISDVRISLSMLSAAGEHWPGAKRSRDILEEISAVIIRRTMKASAYRPSQFRTEEVSEQSGEPSHPPTASETLPPLPMAGFDGPASISNSLNSIGGDQRMDTFDAFPGIFNQDGFLSSVDMDNIMLDMFEDFITPIPYLS